MNSKFIVIEGLEGAGKTTARNIVVDTLRSHGVKEVVFTREPGGTPLAEKLRELIKQGIADEKVTDKAEVLMLYAPECNWWIMSSNLRWPMGNGLSAIVTISSQAYQGGGRGIDQQLLRSLRDTVLGDFRPDLTLYLDLPPAIGLQRARQRGELDRIEQESLAFFDRTRSRYQELAAEDDSILTIDASQSIDAVSADIQATLQQWLQQQGFQPVVQEQH